MTGFAHEAAGSMEWYTPPSIFAALGLAFDLDPCAPAGGVPWIPARRSLSIENDGLTAEWDGRVWLNPPYAAETARWVGRLAEHGDGIALVFARTDTRWWQSAMRRATAACFIAGRLSFVPRDGHQQRTAHGAAAPSMLLAYGAECAAAIAASDLGVVLESTAARRQMELAEDAA